MIANLPAEPGMMLRQQWALPLASHSIQEFFVLAAIDRHIYRPAGNCRHQHRVAYLHGGEGVGCGGEKGGGGFACPDTAGEVFKDGTMVGFGRWGEGEGFPGDGRGAEG